MLLLLLLLLLLLIIILLLLAYILFDLARSAEMYISWLHHHHYTDESLEQFTEHHKLSTKTQVVSHNYQ